MSRRGLLAGSGLAAAGALAAALGTSDVSAAATPTAGSDADGSVPFFGSHQAGISTRQQAYLAFATYDLTASDRTTFTDLLRSWTAAAQRLTAGLPVDGPSEVFAPPPDSGEAVGLGPAALTLTVGFGPSLFDARLGLAPYRPRALVDLPAFGGDDLDPAASGGDLCVQACADDAQVAFHAVRNLTRLGAGAVALRAVQIGAGRTTRPSPDGPTPRNLLGFHDGTNNLDPGDQRAMRRSVWVGDGDTAWMTGGTYLVARRIRIHLEAWDRSSLEEQQQTIGRAKSSGAPLSGRREDDPIDLSALGDNGELLIPDGAHVRQASPALNGGVALLRRGFSFADGIDPTSGELDAGLFFISFQRDPQQFVTVQQRLADNDALAQYVVHTASGVFACPPGTAPGGSWGESLLRAVSA